MRIAWCTGAGKGIGRATALNLARRGWQVAASARTRADLEQLAEDARTAGGSIRPFPLDVTDAAAVRDTIDAIERECGPVALAVLNAGTHQPTPARDFDLATVRTLMETNFFGVVNALAPLLPRLLARHTGHVAVVASVAGYRGLPSTSAYGASKAALINLCESLRPELDACNVQLSLINPGFVRTPLTDRNAFPMPFRMEVEDAAERLVRGLESGRFETTFPRRFTWGLKLLRCLPYALYFPLTRRLIRT